MAEKKPQRGLPDGGRVQVDLEIGRADACDERIAAAWSA